MAETPIDAADPGLRATAANGLLWSGSQAVLSRSFSLLGFIVLARLLRPKEFGVVALANVFVGLFSLLVAGGYSATLVQRAVVDKKDLDTVFWAGLLTGVFLAAVMAVAAWPIAAVLNEPQLRPVLQVLSMGFIFIALGTTHLAVMQRALRFRWLALRTMVADSVSTVFGIGFALLGFGVWALVVQTLVGIGLNSLGVLWRSGYQPSLYVSKERFYGIITDSRHFVGTTFLQFVNMRTDDFLIGTFLGPGPLGIYSVGYRILILMLDVLSTSVQAVAFPVFSRLQGNRDRILLAYQSAARMSAAVAVPMFLLCLALAREMIDVVFGHRWAGAVPVMQILCLFGVLESVAQLNTSLLLGLGRMRFLFRLNLVSTGLQLCAFAAAVPFGIRWVAASYVVRAYVVAPVGFVIAARELGTSVPRTLSVIVRPVISALAMLTALIIAKAALGEATPEPARLALMLCLGVGAYMLALRAIGRAAFDELLVYVRTAARRAGAAPAVARASGDSAVSS